MPRFRVTGVAPAALEALREPLFDELEQALGVPRAHLVLLASGDTPLPEPGLAITPFVEVGWFDRGLEVQDRVSRILTNHLKAAGCEPPDVVFALYARRSYYEDGQPF